MVICLERGADYEFICPIQLMPLPLTFSCFSKIQIGFTFLVPAHLGSPGQRAVKRVCVCVSVMTQRVSSVSRLSWASLSAYAKGQTSPSKALLDAFNFVYIDFKTGIPYDVIKLKNRPDKNTECLG